ncbi:MAG: hypothetical protein AUH85_13815 [Chloroflexi bacterium 13_1_40CM_4_68_4]|nr:MAG: hypothetical protein AUH85_13815 [Chloroflexi bacterium 13_1_40CM_4_68_4]
MGTATDDCVADLTRAHAAASGMTVPIGGTVATPARGAVVAQDWRTHPMTSSPAMRMFPI